MSNNKIVVDVQDMDTSIALDAVKDVMQHGKLQRPVSGFYYEWHTVFQHPANSNKEVHVTTKRKKSAKSTDYFTVYVTNKEKQ